MDSGKCLRRRLLRSTRLPLLCLVAPLRRGARRSPRPTATPRSESRRSTRFSSDVHTLTADFKQELWTRRSTAAANRDRHAVAAPPEPFPLDLRAADASSTVVADGKKLWIYDVELAQVTVAPLDSTVELERPRCS